MGIILFGWLAILYWIAVGLFTLLCVSVAWAIQLWDSKDTQKFNNTPHTQSESERLERYENRNSIIHGIILGLVFFIPIVNIIIFLVYSIKEETYADKGFSRRKAAFLLTIIGVISGAVLIALLQQ